MLSLLSPKNIQAARQQLSSGEEIVSVDEELQRLYRASDDAVNLEALFHTRLGHFFKPIGFYHRKGEVVVLKEYERTLHRLVDEGRIDTRYTICPLELKANAVVGAFSVEALMYALLRRDVSFTANGIKFDMYMNTDGDPQAWADDAYGFDEAVAIYKLGANVIGPTFEFKEEFDNMARQSLLSAYKPV